MLLSVLALSVARLASGATSLPEARSLGSSPLASVADFENVLEGRKKIAWDVRDLSLRFGPDAAGRTLEDYAARFIVDPDREAWLQDLRSRAVAEEVAGDDEGLHDTLRAASEALAADEYRLKVMAMYYVVLQNIQVHELALRSVMSKSPEDESRKSRERLDALPRPDPDGLVEQLTAAPLPEDGQRNPYEPVAAALFDAYNEERVRLAEFAAEWDARHGTVPLGRDRSAPCTGPTPSPSGSETPVTDKSTISRPQFPPDAQRHFFDGTVFIRAEVSAAGCPERVEIARTAGFDALDAAALDWALGLRFHPASKGGAAVASPVVFAVTFRLTD
jgi:TonB family protein